MMNSRTPSPSRGSQGDGSVADTVPATGSGPAPDTDTHTGHLSWLRKTWLGLIWRTVVKSWEDGVFRLSAEAAFWMTLSLPPLLLGLLGSLGFVSLWFGQATIDRAQAEILQLAATVFTPEVVDQIIEPTVTDILTQGRSSLVSMAFVLSLWAGSSALAALVDSITTAYRQHTVRHPIWQRTFVMLLYLVLLIGSVVVIPLVVLGPGMLAELLPASAQPRMADLVGVFYYPVLGLVLMLGLATLYKIVLPNKLPWHRGLGGALLAVSVFLVTTTVLRAYIGWVTSTGYTYGALAAPIAFLLFSFFIAMAIVLGAEFNNAIQETWPAHPTKRERRRWRRLEMDRYAARRQAERDRRQQPRDGPDTGVGDARPEQPADGARPAPDSPPHTSRRPATRIQVARRGRLIQPLSEPDR